MIDNIKGLIRPFISVAFTITAMFLAITGKIDPGEVLSITGIIVAFHFGERAASK